MNQFLQGLRVAARGFAKQPTLALAIVLTLALGIGANTAIFSFVDSVLLNPPPFNDPERVVAIWGWNSDYAKILGFEDLPISNAIFYDYERDNTSFESMGLLQSSRMTMTGRGEAEQLGVVLVGGDFFSALGTSAAIGRTLLPEDDVPGNPSAVVISHNCWQRLFGGKPEIVGEKLILDKKPMTVVGVMPPRFAFPRGGSEVPAAYSFASEPDAWVPFALTDEEKANRAARFSLGVGRLKEGVGVEAGQAELQAIAERYGELHPQTDKGWDARLVTISEQMAGNLRPMILTLWAAVGFVLLIACANVAGLLLTRAVSRQKEIAMRTALGAGSKRLIVQLLTEAGLLSIVGGVLAVAIAFACLRLFSANIPAGTAGAASFALDVRTVVFTAILCIATTMLAGLLPALQTVRPDLVSSLREGARAGSATSRRTQRVLVVLEVAVAVVLLVGAGLLLRSFVRILSIDPGFDAKGVATYRIDLPYSSTPPERVAFFEHIVEKMRGLTGVQSAAVISELPLGGSEQFVKLNFEGRPLPEEGEDWSASMHSTTPDYFKTMEIPLLEGRYLAMTDVSDSTYVAVIDEQMARVYWPGEEALGKRFRTGTGEAPWITVVGIVGSIRHTALQDPPEPTMYVPLGQAPKGLTPVFAWVVVRTSASAQALLAEARAGVHEVDSNQAVTELRTMETVLADSMVKRRFTLILLGFFAVLALVLAVVGIYGITSHSVTQGQRELGVRMALGAKPKEVLWMVLKDAALLAGLGVVLGVGAAIALTRLMSSLVYGVEPTDVATFSGVALGLLLVALAAAFLPALRATRVSPTVTLQAQ